MLDIPSFAQLNIDVTLPAALLAVWATTLLLLGVFIPDNRKHVTPILAVLALVVSFVLNLVYYNAGEQAFEGMFIADTFSGFVNIVALLTAFLSVMLAYDYMQRTGIESSEFYPLLLFTTSGIMFMGHANDLLVVFVALELLSIPLYILAAFRYPELKSEEAGLKYFILGAFASAFFVYGAALTYGSTGTTNLREVALAVGSIISGSSSADFLLLIGTGLLLVGLGFKVAVAPFHMWTPDVYEGAPTPVAAFMSVGAKLGGFAALLRIMAFALPAFIVTDGSTTAAWQDVVWILAAVTLILSNIVAVAQTNIKRMLAYSSISHAGFIMMAVAAAGSAGVTDAAIQAALVYLLTYMFANLGAFGVALAIEKDDGSGTQIDDFVGLAKSRPMLAIMMSVFMLSLTGIPLTGGFIGKWFVFKATLDADLVPLAVIAVLMSAVSAFYYIRVVVNMYLRDGDGDAAAGATSYVTWAVYASFAGTILLGIFPFLATDLTNSITLAASIFGG